MVKHKQNEQIEAVPDDTVAWPKSIPNPCIAVTVDKPFYGYKKAKIDLVSIIMDITKCSADAAFDIMHRAGRKTAFRDKDNNPIGEAIVAIEIPAGAKCVLGVDINICRCDSARVVDVRPICESYGIMLLAKKILSDQHVAFECKPEEGGTKLRTAYTDPVHGERMTYFVGGFVKPVFDFNDNPSMVCASGIHFLLHKTEAIEYVL